MVLSSTDKTLATVFKAQRHFLTKADAGMAKLDSDTQHAPRKTSWKAYLESLQADSVQHKHNEIQGLNIEPGHQKSRVENLRSDLKQANQSFMAQQDVIACMHHKDMQWQQDNMQNTLTATTEELNVEIIKNWVQNKKIWHYEHSKKLYKARIQDLEDWILSEVNCLEVIWLISQWNITKTLHCLKNTLTFSSLPSYVVMY